VDLYAFILWQYLVCEQQMQEGFRKGLIIRYGLEEVEWLENNK
jgi:hypothetical protein